jgi:pimeloyl-ACP methyl ester carboxylesterase/protein-S-isoprenylcysteine O-methyltransferase Ste14
MPRWIRALLAFLALPGIVAFAVPLLLIWPAPVTRPPRTLGLIVLITGAFLLLWCVRDFFVAGKGTLAPWDPPRRLVIVGLYRFSRNPMYVAVSLILMGWSLSYGSMTLDLYTLGMMVLFHLRVVYGEEPWLERTHREEWRHYRERVPRWLFRRARTAWIALILFIAVGAAAGGFIEWFLQASAARRYPAPGRMVDVGGRLLHLVCMGQGEPAVIFEAPGFGVSSLNAATVRARVAADTRVCSYDRQGMGWSDAGPEQVTSLMLAQDLLTLENHAGLRKPSILVASSIGGLTVEMFARKHPERVAGLVFLDAASSGALPIAAPRFDIAAIGTCALTATANFGLIRFVDPFQMAGDRTEQGRRSRAFTYGAKALGTVCAIVRGLPNSLHEFEAVPPLPSDVRMVVLSAEHPLEFLAPFTNTIQDARLQVHQDLARRSSRGEWRIVPGSEHLIASSKPDEVSRVILSMLADIRAGR